MATLIYVPPVQHGCYGELEKLDPVPVGTIAECSCGIQYVKREHQLDGPYWGKRDINHDPAYGDTHGKAS